MIEKIYIKNASVILPARILKNSSVTILGERVSSVGPVRNPPSGAKVIDASGLYVAPGFIDTHIHGLPEDIFDNEIRYGTTSIVVALSCDSLPRLYAKVDRIKRFIDSNRLGGNVVGVRLEGPYINKLKSGAQDKSFIHRADPRELIRILKRCGPLLKMMTVAPEIPGAGSIIKILKAHGVIASIGHSNALYKEAVRGIDKGITHATHLFNAMRGMNRGYPGAADAVLADRRVIAEIILDMVHVNKECFAIAAKSKRPDKLVLITDSIRADLKKGVWEKDGVYWVSKNVKAGSCLNMIGAVKNAVTLAGVSLIEAVRFVTLNPAKLFKIDKTKGSIAAGKDADLVIFDKNFDVKMVMVRGRISYHK
ncbi:MAG: N-acetylglucosamine-6-phosphate deacetylase [Candidatus Omnitrophica bacterium]|nr:N-acetylglucosamine-6-phosphate deacetylase [Candidatus Omnitrophota bacterium]